MKGSRPVLPLARAVAALAVSVVIGAAGSGCLPEASATMVFPAQSGGVSSVSRPSSAGSSGVMTATTPVGSGAVKL